jgi:hypothetical protein
MHCIHRPYELTLFPPFLPEICRKFKQARDQGREHLIGVGSVYVAISSIVQMIWGQDIIDIEG